MTTRLSDAELDRLIEAQRLMRKADSTSGPQAISLYKQAAKLTPWDEVYLMSIGVEYAQAGDYRKGGQRLEEALALNPDNQRVRKNLNAVKQAAR